MIVCVCRVVTDTAIRKTVEAGAKTVADVARACGAGGGCGNCKHSIDQIIDECRQQAGADRAPACKKAA